MSRIMVYLSTLNDRLLGAETLSAGYADEVERLVRVGCLEDRDAIKAQYRIKHGRRYLSGLEERTFMTTAVGDK